MGKSSSASYSPSSTTSTKEDEEPTTEIQKLLTDPSGWKSLVTFFVLAIAWVVGFSSRLFAVIRFESIIHEFDPWFNYRATHFMVENGYYQFLNWFDERAWYPLGRIVGGTVYPGLMVTSGAIHYVLNSLHILVHIREICVFLAPIFSGLTAIATYLLTTELWSPGAGLFAACFISIVPGYISRSVAGSYDNEGIAIFALQFTYYLWVKSVKTGSVFWSCLASLSYFYMVSAWGGYVFIINLIPLHVFVLVLMGRFTPRLYIAYSTFYILGLIFSMQIPFVGFQPIRTSEHMAAAGVFGLVNAYVFLQFIQAYLTKREFRYVFVASILIVLIIGFLGVAVLTYLGLIAPWSGRFYSLWDTGYAKIHIPIIASVSEHQPTTWVAFFFDLHILAAVFPVGAWYCVKHINDERVFVILYAIFAVYFAGVMVRLMLTLTPVVCILAGIAFSHTYERYLKDETMPQTGSGLSNQSLSLSGSERRSGKGSPYSYAVDTEMQEPKNLYDKPGKTKKPKTDGSDTKELKALATDTPSSILSTNPEEDGVGMNVKSVVSIALVMILLMFAVHCTWVTSNAYSSPSIVLASYHQDGSRTILDDFREAYYWLRRNTDDKARVMSWWDYGYQIAGMANRTTLVDNNTWNNSHIALVGKAMSSNETEAIKIMRALDVDYVLVIFGGFIGYSGDDINKFLWMVRIAEGEHPKDIRESDYFTEQGEFKVDTTGSKTLLNCLMYKMSYYRFGEVQLDFRTAPGFDRTRGAEIGNKNFDLVHLEEAYTTEHWLVRIFKVKKPENRPAIKYTDRKIKSKKSTSKVSEVMPCVIAGSLAAGNRQAIDWGWQGFVAYGCQSLVVVWHPTSMERVNTLDGHRQHVVKVRWARENYPHSETFISTALRPNSSGRGGQALRLASADSAGQIIIWDVLKGRPLCQFSDGHKPVLEMQWLASQDLSVDLLVALHAPYNFILWNAQEGTKVWKKGYTETLVGFTLDPFQTAHAAFLTQAGNVMMIDDFSTAKSPSSNGQQFRVAAVTGGGDDQEIVVTSGSGQKKQTAATLANLLVKKPLVKVFTSVASGMGGNIDLTDPLSSSSAGQQQLQLAAMQGQMTTSTISDDATCLQLVYHRAVRNRLLLLYPKELVILDVVSMQSVAQVILDRSASPFVHVYPCSQRDAIYFFQENGCITLRVRKYRGSAASADTTQKLEQTLDVYNPVEIIYESACSSESLRITKTNRVLAGTVCPITECRSCQVMAQGRLLVYELASGIDPTSGLEETITVANSCFQSLADDIVVDIGTLNQETPAPGKTKLRFVMSGAANGLAPNPTVLRACPKPSGPGRQLAAVGFGDGGIQLVDIHSGEVERDFSLHSCPIKCLEWSGADHLVSSGHCQTLSTSSVVRNEILLTDIRTGFSRRLRGECDESPVEMLRVSYFSCFLAIAFRDQPMEIWDLKEFRLLRRMSKNCPVIVDLAWSTKHHQSRIVSTNAENENEAQNQGQQQQMATQLATSPITPNPLSPSEEVQQTIYRENLVVLDNENHLYHVVVKGIHVRDGKEVNTQWATNSLVTCMAWKDDLLAFGDVDGRLSVWNLDAKTSKATGQQRGAMRRLQMARAPSDFTLIALHNDGAAVWNALRFECLCQVSTATGVISPPGLLSSMSLPWRLIDGDIAGDENWPMFLTSDGALRVFDRSMANGSNRNIEALLGQKIFVGRFQVSWKTTALLKTLLMDVANLNRIYSGNEEADLLGLGTTEESISLPNLVKRLDIDEQDKWTLMRQLTFLDDAMSTKLSELSTVERCLLVSALFGEEWEYHFWTVVGHYLDEKRSQALISTSYEAFWNADDFKRWQIKQCSVFDCRRATPDQLHKMINEFIQLGLYSQASQLLLDTDCQQADYYADCLKACLLSTLAVVKAAGGTDGQDSGSSSAGSTVKLVATNLIANGRLSEGVQLLTMIGKALDACRYLQSFGHWEQSAWLARVALPKGPRGEVLGKWIDALQGPQMAKKTVAVLLMITCGQWERIIDLLIGWKQLGMSIQLLEYEPVKEKATDKVKEIIRSEYAKELAKLGLMKAARWYAKEAGGERGESMLKEIEIVSE